VVQLKLIYMHYVIVTSREYINRTHPSLPKKTISMEEVINFAKDFKLSPSLLKERQLLQLFEDMTIRKPGPLSSLEHGEIPFNQWVQFLFHVGFRFCKPAPVTNEGEEEGSHLHMITLLRKLDDSLAKGRLRTKGVKPFTLS